MNTSWESNFKLVLRCSLLNTNTNITAWKTKIFFKFAQKKKGFFFVLHSITLPCKLLWKMADSSHNRSLHSHPIPLPPTLSNSSNNLKRHVAAVHKKSERFPCPHCKFVSYYRDNVRRHIQTVHDENAQVHFQTLTKSRGRPWAATLFFLRTSKIKMSLGCP